MGVMKKGKEAAPQFLKATALQIMPAFCNKSNAHINRQLFFIRVVLSVILQEHGFLKMSSTGHIRNAANEIRHFPQYYKPTRQQLFLWAFSSKAPDS
jgi:hypothetical protein